MSISTDRSDIVAHAAKLLATAGIVDKIESVRLNNAGGNNRIYRVDTAGGSFAAKQYFRHEGDTRDRLGAEYAFLSYAYPIAPDRVPQPLARDEQTGTALYEFVLGDPLTGIAVGQQEIDAAISFFTALNGLAARQKATNLPLASESSFSIAGHLRLIGARINQLLSVAPVSEIDRQGYSFIRTLAEYWEQLEGEIRRQVRMLNWDMEDELPLEQRCISPSDFGFHNALRGRTGNLRFLDFEYAGWDDPAKTAGDFFSQLAVPVPPEYFDYFVEGIMVPFANPQLLAERARLLRPVYQIKWCCIALNVFLPVHLARRKFANAALDEISLKQAQLTKAQKILQFIPGLDHGLH